MTGQLLDVGAYIGVFVEVAASRAGWQALGVEPSTWAVEVARQRDLCVLEGTQEHPDLAGRQFDVVTMWDVIEHVADPKRELQLAYDLLRPGGVLAVHTMDVHSLFARLMGPRWPWLMSMHIHYFSRASLEGLLRACGYEILFNGIQGRYLRLGYLASRVEALSKPLGGVIRPVVKTLRPGQPAHPHQHFRPLHHLRSQTTGIDLCRRLRRFRGFWFASQRCLRSCSAGQLPVN